MAITLEQGPVVGNIERQRRHRRVRVSLAGRLGLALLGTIVLVAMSGPLLWPHDPEAQNVMLRLQGPSAAFPLGTDGFGRDILARLLAGARWSLAGAAIVCLGTSALGFTLGALAATGRAATDAALGRLIEALMAVPSLVTALAITALLGPSFPNLLLALIMTSWPWYARTYRALIMQERAALYVEGAVVQGATRARVIFRHMLPNIGGPAIVIATGHFGNVILALASLSFLGLGMQPPTPEWGMMINEARNYFQRQPWQMVAPGLAIALTVLAINLTGDATRDLLDPHGFREVGEAWRHLNDAVLVAVR
jgi:ABC-type dipeptide/oligopeptide/nickel transport system permease subunit